jgi:hypothetical protein
MKSYFTTVKYLKEFLTNGFPGNGDPCTQNGTMKHMERLLSDFKWQHILSNHRNLPADTLPSSK